MENMIDVTEEIKFDWIVNTCHKCNEMFHSLKESEICYVCRYLQLAKEQLEKEHEDIS